MRRDWVDEVIAELRRDPRLGLTAQEIMHRLLDTYMTYWAMEREAGHRPPGPRAAVDAAIAKLRRQGRARYDRDKRVWRLVEVSR